MIREDRNKNGHNLLFYVNQDLHCKIVKTSASGSVNRAEISSINKEIKAYVQPKTAKKYSTVHVTLRMKSENTLF